MVRKHKQKRRISETMERATRNTMLLLKRNSRSLLKTRKGRRQKKSSSTFKKIQISDDESKKSVSSFAESGESGEIFFL